MQRALRGGPRDRPARHRDPQPRRFPQPARGRVSSTTIPAQGIIDGPTFTHPDLRIQFRVPPGYLMSNGTTAVTISGSAGKAQFSGGRFDGIARRNIYPACSSS